MKVRFFDPGIAYLTHKPEILKEIDRILTAGDLILRADVEKFEQNLAGFVGTKYAVALNSGTDALYLALKALNLPQGAEISVPSHTFVATAQVVAQQGLKPILYDLNTEINLTNSKAFMVAHIAGELTSFPPMLNIPIIEDACQALGAVKNPTSTAQCWSFYPAKILGAFGDAGALTTNSKEIYDYVMEARNHFKSDYSQWGINSRMDNLQAAILNVKFKYLPKVLKRRTDIAWKYNKGLDNLNDNLNLILPNSIKGRVWQDYIVRTDKRNELYEYLKTGGIETMKNEYPFPIHKLPKSIAYEAQTLRLPINETITDGQVDYVINNIKQFYV